MKKHILLIIWISIFFGIAVHIALISVLFGRPDYYDTIISVEVIIFFLLIPLIIIDLKLSSRQKIKKEMQERDLELLKKEAEIQALKKQRGKITEEDIEISKERHICLVHKGIIKGYSFICPECGAFYCEKCVNALKEIENECWSCGNPLDPSLPIRKYDLMEQDKYGKKKGKAKILTSIEIIRNSIDNSPLLEIFEKEESLIKIAQLMKEFDLNSISLEFLEKVDEFEWEEEDKIDFITEMLSFTPEERKEILTIMVEKSKKL